ncbi:L-proline dehydrogenase [Carpediemonas membranifera]|uniref:L-proline dehydrogenase n=1 Tax=Carpediemonas membranifera TaxID=201153 RepID=A0A8J6C0K6_9EUKA|nr:L-proline dehydrogenase [Carpediemonas membranifera]|eukprot:KAG9396681.1 L-proline dehydrogenase [Carpediemonas membranifera]
MKVWHAFVLSVIFLYVVLLYPTLRDFSGDTLLSNTKHFYSVELPSKLYSLLNEYDLCDRPFGSETCNYMNRRFPFLANHRATETETLAAAIAKTQSLTVGFTLEETIENSLALNKEGYRMLLNIGGEHYRAGEEDKAVADTAKYIKLSRMMAKAGVVGSISIKPSQLGMEISPDLFESNLNLVAKLCHELGVGLEVDIEQRQYREQTVASYINALRALGLDTSKPHGIRIAHQAEFKDTVEIAQTIAQEGGEIRLVRGKAYSYEAGDPAAAQHWGTEEELQAAFLECAVVCEKGLAIATGWPELIETTVRAVGHDVETQFLYGLPWHKPTQDVQLEKGRVVTLYAISGDWSLVRGYVSRRGLLTIEELEAMDAEFLG